MLAIVYIYAVISFALLRTEFTEGSGQGVFCDTLDQCFVSVLRFGLIDSFLVSEKLQRNGRGKLAESDESLGSLLYIIM